MLPPNATPQEKALEGATERVGTAPVPIRALWDVDTCPPELLPWLAWAMSVDVWDNAWPDAIKRQAIKDSVAIHRTKGTVGAVERALAPYGVEIVEWFQETPPEEPYTFHIEISGGGYSEDDFANIIAIAERTKNVRSHMRFRAVTEGTTYLAAGCVCGETVSVGI